VTTLSLVCLSPAMCTAAGSGHLLLLLFILLSLVLLLLLLLLSLRMYSYTASGAQNVTHTLTDSSACVEENPLHICTCHKGQSNEKFQHSV